MGYAIPRAISLPTFHVLIAYLQCPKALDECLISVSAHDFYIS